MRNIFLILMLGLLTACSPGTQAGKQKAEKGFSGNIENGLRIITIENNLKKPDFHVYRGDYVVFRTTDSGPAKLSIPDLSIDADLPIKKENHLKFKDAGKFSIYLDGIRGLITVHEYKQVNYTEISSEEARSLLETVNPIVLDVRTPGEYASGYIAKAILLPVQELEARLDEISQYKDQPVLVYCASGNRSSVASRMLIDSGFKRVYNLRFGIGEWIGKAFPVEAGQ